MSAIRSLPEFAERLLEYIREHSRPNTSSDSHQDYNALALDLFALQFESVPVYQSLCRKRQLTPGRISNWQEIPALPAGAFKEFEVSSLPEAERSRVFLSSGTTGQSH